MTIIDGQVHKPVLVKEVMQCLQPSNSGLYVDCTFGRGGYSKEILERIDSTGCVLALDADPEAIAYGRKMFAGEPRLVLRHCNFDQVGKMVADLQFAGQVKGVVFDLGVSSPQLEDAERGFSFRNDGPLDMRMNTETGLKASDWIENAGFEEIRRVISRYGEEPFADRIARKLVEVRDARHITTTADLADIVYAAIPEKEKRKRKIHPATKVFQAIRVHVNDELGRLDAGLKEAEKLMQPGSVMAVVSFHSLEDRIVKRFFRHLVQGDIVPDKVPLPFKDTGGNYEYICKRVTPSNDEVLANPRARSSRLRAVRKIR